MTTLVHLKHGYDQAGNRLYRRDEVARTNSASFDELYGYDNLNRLTSFDRGQLGSGNTSLSSGPTLNQSWTLDQLGNWTGFTQTVQNALTQTRTHNTANEITDIDKTVGADWPTPAYDANGNMTEMPRPFSLTNTYNPVVYDAWNRVVSLSVASSTVARYEYDGLNRRIVKEANSVTRHYYHSDRWQVLEERTGSSSSADRQYLWGQQYVDDLIFRDHSSTRLYALTDALFNVVALTDDDGAVVERFAYQPYGESAELNPNFTTYSGTDYKWEYRFTGRELDLDSGLQLNRNRYLHLQLGRWLTRDPIGYEAGMNLYEYIGGYPSTYVDPLGFAKTAPGVPDHSKWWIRPRPKVNTRDFLVRYGLGGGAHLHIPSSDVEALLNDPNIMNTVNDESVMSGIVKDAGLDCGGPTSATVSGSFVIPASSYGGTVGNTLGSIATDDFHVYGNTNIMVSYSGTVSISCGCCPEQITSMSFNGTINYIVQDRFANPTDIGGAFNEGPETDPYGSPYGFSGNYFTKQISEQTDIPCASSSGGNGGGAGDDRRDRRERRDRR